MSIQTSAVIFVGLPFGEFPKYMQELLNENPDEYYDSGIQMISPYFDADIEQCYFGEIIVDSTSFENDILEKLTDSQIEIFKLLGIHTKMYVLPHVS